MSDIEYSIKLQRLIESLKYDTETPYPELHHHKMIVAAKTRIRKLEAALRKCISVMDWDEGESANVVAKVRALLPTLDAEVRK